MTAIDFYCPRCGYVNNGSPPESGCQLCGAIIEKPFVDPKGEILFGIDLKLVSFGSMVSAIVSQKGYLSKLTLFPLAGWSVFTRRASRKPWVKPKFKGSVLRYVASSLEKAQGIDKKKLKTVTQELKKNGFTAGLDLLCETHYPGAYQRIFANEAKGMYAVASFSSAMRKMDLKVITLLDGNKGLISVSNALPDFIEDPEGNHLLISGGNVRTLINALAKAAPLKKRRMEGFGLQTILRELVESHKRLFDRSIKEKRLVLVNRQAAANQWDDISQAPECAFHEGVIAIRECALCGHPLCGQCQFHYEGREYCSACLPEEAGRSGDSPLDLSGDYTPAGFFIRGSIRVAELSIFCWLAFTLFPGESSPASIIIYQALVMLGLIAYFQTSVALWGATPMQKMAGLTVIDEMGDRLSVTSTIVRTGYLLLSIITIIPVLGYLPSIWDKYKRGWHDRLAGTIVVTDHASLKDKVGAALLALMITFAIYNHSQIYTSVLNITYSSLQSLTGPGNISFERVWSRRTGRNQVLIDGKRVVTIAHGRVMALNKLNGSPIWKSETPGIDMVFGSVATRYYFAVEELGSSTRIYAIGKNDGVAKWEADIPGRLGSIPLVSEDGVRLIAGSRVTAIDNNGQVVWNIEPGETPVAIYNAGENILVETKSGERRKTDVYSQKNGKRIVTLDGLSPVTRVGDQKYLLAGEGGTSLFDFKIGKIAWSLPDTLSMVDTAIKSGSILHSEKSARRMSDGMQAFSYPAGCLYTGLFKQVVALYCANEGSLNIVNANTGASLAAMKSGSTFRTIFIGEDNGAYILLTLGRIRERLLDANLFLLKYESRSVTVFNVGHLREEPRIEYIDGKGLLIVSSNSAGLYKPPWELAGQ